MASGEDQLIDGDFTSVDNGKKLRRRIVIIAASIVALGAAVYAVDFFSSSDRVPRGVQVAGVAVGGQTIADAESTLRQELGTRSDTPITVDAGDSTAELTPADAGLAIDWAATLDRVGEQPVSPITRLTSLFTHRDVGVESTVDGAALTSAIDALRPQLDHASVEGAIAFDGPTPVPTEPRQGQTVDSAGAAASLTENWATSDVIDLPVTVTDVAVDSAAVDAALRDVAEPAVSAPVVFTGENGSSAQLAPADVGAVLSFEPDGDGNLAPRYNTDAATALLAPQLAPSERPAVDASFSFATGAPTVVPGTDGYAVAWPATLEALPDLLTTENRTAAAQYGPRAPNLTTDAARALGINEVIGEFTSGGFEYASGVNIGLTADIVNGALVLPGANFSLNGYTGTRGTAQGFVESGIIDNGRPDRAVGGGISQFATTLYNAGYFGGMEDVDHTEHSYYISRYPEAREATVFEPVIDLVFRNPGTTGVLVQSFADESSVTVKLWGTKTVDVESITGDRYAPTTPNTVTLPRGDDCIASSGANGFTTSNTRVISDAATGAEISRRTRTVKYDPVPIVRCI